MEVPAVSVQKSVTAVGNDRVAVGILFGILLKNGIFFGRSSIEKLVSPKLVRPHQQDYFGGTSPSHQKNHIAMVNLDSGASGTIIGHSVVPTKPLS